MKQKITFEKKWMAALFLCSLFSITQVYAYESHVINNQAELVAFNNRSVTGKETIQNLTIRGADVTEAEIKKVKDKVAKIVGTVTWEGLDLVADGNYDFFGFISCEGSIVLKDCPRLDNMNGFSMHHYTTSVYTTIGGDFIIDNCPKVITGASFGGWEKDCFTGIVEVKGTLQLSGLTNAVGTATFPILKKVGGDLILTGNTNFSNLNDLALETIGGNLIIKNNASFGSLAGLDKLTSLGGNVTVLDNGQIPNQSSGSKVGYCIFKSYKVNGTIGAGATIEVGNTGSLVNVDALTPCLGDNVDIEDLVINGQAELVQFFNTTSPSSLVIRNFTLKGADIVQADVDNLKSKIQKIIGVTTWEDLGNGVDGNFYFHGFIRCEGGIVFKNCAGLSNVNGFSGHHGTTVTYATIGGDFIIENCPKIITGGSFGGWENDCFTQLKEVKGSLKFDGIKTPINSATFPLLKKVGGDFILKNLPELQKFSENNFSLGSIGGDLILENNPKYDDLKGLDKLTSIGGDVITITGNAIPVSYSVGSGKYGVCLVKDYLNKGIISNSATITLNVGGTTIAIGELAPCNPTDIKDVANDKTRIYPNPVVNNLSIESNGDLVKVEVFDIVGKLVYSTTRVQSSIDLSKLASGNYILSLTKKGNSVEKLKIIKL